MYSSHANRLYALKILTDAYTLLRELTSNLTHQSLKLIVVLLMQTPAADGIFKVRKAPKRIRSGNLRS